MKSFGNLVRKYCSAEEASEYKDIVADTKEAYWAAQLVYLRKFIAKYKPNTSERLCNADDHAKNIDIHKKAIEAEIARLEAQTGKGV